MPKTSAEVLFFIDEELARAKELAKIYAENNLPIGQAILMTPHRYLELLALERDSVLKEFPNG